MLFQRIYKTSFSTLQKRNYCHADNYFFSPFFSVLGVGTILTCFALREIHDHINLKSVYLRDDMKTEVRKLEIKIDNLYGEIKKASKN
jgi:hypothetical protein